MLRGARLALTNARKRPCNRTPHRCHRPAKAAWQSWPADGPEASRSLERRMRPLYLSAMLFLAASSVARADDLACVSTTFRFTSPSDKVCVSNFDDPKVPGVTCFISQARKGESCRGLDSAPLREPVTPAKAGVRFFRASRAGWIRACGMTPRDGTCGIHHIQLGAPELRFLRRNRGVREGE